MQLSLKTPVIVCYALCFVVVGCLESDEVRVFNNLQTWPNDLPEHVLAGPYPVGATLNLSCQTFDSNTSWWREGKRVVHGVYKFVQGKLFTSTLHWPYLSQKDNGLKRTCRISDSTKYKEIELKVIEIPSSLNINDQPAGKSKTNLTCTASSISSHLKLCWFKSGKRIVCNDETEKTEGSGSQKVSVLVRNTNRLSELTCVSRLAGSHPRLTKAAEKSFRDMCNLVNKTITVENGKLVPKEETNSCRDGYNDCEACNSDSNCAWSARFHMCTVRGPGNEANSDCSPLQNTMKSEPSPTEQSDFTTTEAPIDPSIDPNPSIVMISLIVVSVVLTLIILVVLVAIRLRFKCFPSKQTEHPSENGPGYSESRPLNTPETA